jgi:predicted TIM-barrel fold metal-dependent hydrolase
VGGPANPNSSGTGAPRLATPALACDSHIHIYDPRFLVAGSRVRLAEKASVADYRRLQARIGTSRTVVVTPAAYRTDNRVTLDAIQALGADCTRGVAVVHPEVTDAELEALDEGGVRGIRFTLFDPATAVTRFDMVEPLAHRASELGWHVQLHWRADQIVPHADLLDRLPCTLVFDHMGRMPQPEGAGHAAFGIVARLLDRGRTWVKLSGPYLDSQGPAYADRVAVARAYVRAAPERLVWGSDWPHPTEKESNKPDDAALLDLLSDWAGDEALRARILVDNPARLYGFP